MLRSHLLELALYLLISIFYSLFLIFLYRKIKNKRIALFLVILALILFAATRYNVGSDYDTYTKQYNELGKYFKNAGEIIKSDFQCGFTLMMYFLHKIWSSNLALFDVHAIIIYPITMIYLKRNSRDFSESLFLYFFLQFHMISLNLLKQVISMTILLINKKNIAKNNLTLILLSTFLMAAFHISSIFGMITVILAKYIKPTIKKMYIILALSLLSLFVYKSLIAALGLNWRYDRYLTDINYDYYIVTIGAIVYLIVQMIILYHLLRKKNELIKMNPDNSFILSALILSIPVKVLAIDNFPIYRLSLYIDQFLLFIIPDLIAVHKRNSPKWRFQKEYLLYVLFLIAYFIFAAVFIPHNNFYSYQTIFSLTGE